MNGSVDILSRFEGLKLRISNLQQAPLDSLLRMLWRREYVNKHGLILMRKKENNYHTFPNLIPV